jgi:hypothetical protein
MERLSHGALLMDDPALVPLQPPPTNVHGNFVDCPNKTRFGYLFQSLQENPDDHLPDKDLNGVKMAETLIKLGNSMTDPDSPGTGPADPRFNSPIASVYTYFGQFITHEVVFEVAFKDRKLGPDTVPLDAQELSTLKNARTTQLDLDSIYGPMLDNHDKCYPVPMKDKEMALGIAGNGDEFRGFDLPRQVDSPFTAIIGDRRNDSNLIASQLHLAFLRMHNTLVRQDKDKTLAEAQTLLRQHFQWLVIHDYLPRVTDDDVRESILTGKTDVFKSVRNRSFMPLEFSAAAFRFAHSMPRSRYDYNRHHKKVRLSELFLPIPQYSRILEEWIIDWSRFVPGGGNFARLIDTRLVQPLFHLIDSEGKPVVDSTPEKKVISLAALDLLRGYLLRLPTGQAVARELGEAVLSAADIEDAAGRIVQDDTAANQKAILKDSGLSQRTPLWFYVLAEAAVQKQGACLGRVGSTIVAGVLIDLVRRSTDSILSESNWVPTLGQDHTFSLTDLFKIAGVLPAPTETKGEKDNGN